MWAIGEGVGIDRVVRRAEKLKGDGGRRLGLGWWCEWVGEVAGYRWAEQWLAIWEPGRS